METETLNWRVAGNGTVHRRKRKPVTAETISETRRKWLEKYFKRQFVGLRFNANAEPLAAFVAYDARIGVDEYSRNDPRCDFQVDVPPYQYTADLKIRRTYQQVKRDLEDFAASDLEKIFPWNKEAIEQIKAAVTAFVDYERQYEYEARLGSLPGDEIADQIRRGEDYTTYEDRLPLKFVFDQLLKNETNKHFVELLKGRRKQPDWKKLQENLDSSPINEALWEKCLSGGQTRWFLIQSFLYEVGQTGPSRRRDFIIDASLKWFASSPQFIADLFATNSSRYEDTYILEAVEALLKDSPPNVQIGALRALPKMQSGFAYPDAGFLIEEHHGDEWHSLCRRVYLELPLALRDRPPTEEVGAEAAKTCMAVKSKIADALQERRRCGEHFIASAESEINRLKDEIRENQERILEKQGGLAQVSVSEQALTLLFEPQKPNFKQHPNGISNHT